MDTNKAIQILEALASGCSPSTGELLDKESILNDRDVIRALQMGIDQLRLHNYVATNNVEIEQNDINSVIALFDEVERNPSSNNLAGFFLGTKQFKNQNLISNQLYGKLRGIYTRGQLIDFFSRYLSDNNILTKNSFRNVAYKQIDFFQKEKFNKLTPNATNQLKAKISELGILKTENLPDYIQEARKIHYRAYEHWSEKEMELLSKAIKYTNDLDLLSECFQRGKGSIESVGQKIIFHSGSPVDKT
jgi:ribosomal protein S18